MCRTIGSRCTIGWRTEKIGGFLSAANPEGKRALGYYDATTLNYYYALANTFAIGDRYFSAVPGPTFPNRMFFLSASSFGHAKNTAPPPRATRAHGCSTSWKKKNMSWVRVLGGLHLRGRHVPAPAQGEGRALSAHFRISIRMHLKARVAYRFSRGSSPLMRARYQPTSTRLPTCRSAKPSRRARDRLGDEQHDMAEHCAVPHATTSTAMASSIT